MHCELSEQNMLQPNPKHNEEKANPMTSIGFELDPLNLTQARAHC